MRHKITPSYPDVNNGAMVVMMGIFIIMPAAKWVRSGQNWGSRPFAVVAELLGIVQGSDP